MRLLDQPVFPHHSRVPFPGSGEIRGEYIVRFAASASDIRAVQALRFAVFNLEMRRGLDASSRTFLDADPFDEVCRHLLVEHVPTGEVVGTYRLQSGRVADTGLGFYSGLEFDLEPMSPYREQIIELGRACVHWRHRNLIVLRLLWRAIAAFAREQGARYLMGCSSLNSVDPAVGATAYSCLMRTNLAAEPFQTVPWPEFACPLDRLSDALPEIPKLMGAYLALGAKICGAPALDRAFKTIDFLTWLDLETMPPRVAERFLR